MGRSRQWESLDLQIGYKHDSSWGFLEWLNKYCDTMPLQVDVDLLQLLLS